VVSGGQIMPPKCLVQYAKEYQEAFHIAIDMPSIIGVNPETRSTQWQKPPPGQLKINWDVAVDKRYKLMGVGIVIRDHHGAVRAAMCWFRILPL
jgi:hypothetical protein